MRGVCRTAIVFLLACLTQGGVTHADEVEVRFNDPFLACSMVAWPGDFILQKMGAVAEVDEFFGGQENPASALATESAMRLGGLLSLRGIFTLELFQKMTYRHSEVISKIEAGKNFVTKSYYPAFGTKGERPIDEVYRQYDQNDKDYRSHFDVYRVKDSSSWAIQELRETAIEAVRTPQNFGGWGLSTCADFVNWAYGTHITSFWNFVPFLRKGIANLYVPEAINTPDGLAESPYTHKICEFSDRYTVNIPDVIDLKEYRTQIRRAQKSKIPELKSHADFLYRTWTKLKILKAGEKNPRYTTLRIKGPMPGVVKRREREELIAWIRAQNTPEEARQKISELFFDSEGGVIPHELVRDSAQGHLFSGGSCTSCHQR